MLIRFYNDNPVQLSVLIHSFTIRTKDSLYILILPSIYVTIVFIVLKTRIWLFVLR